MKIDWKRNLSILIWLWCFPQMIFGFILKKATNARKVNDHYEYNLNCGSICLGSYIFLCPPHWQDKTALAHEMGHQKQSLILGWLYLIVIGFPSIVWCGLFRKYRKTNNISYYSFYTEKWADKLGGVKR